jgi:capsular polysaccharide biosynthesis protein
MDDMELDRYYSAGPRVLIVPNGAFQWPDVYLHCSKQLILPSMCECCTSPSNHSTVRYHHKILPIVHVWSGAYYHFVVEALPRLVTAAKALGSLDDVMVIVPRGGRFISQYMDILGYSHETVQEQTTYMAEEMIVPSFMSCIRPLPQSIELLRSMVLSKLGISAATEARKSDPIIVIKRARTRSISNHKVLMQHLKEAFSGEHLTEAILEAMSVEQQIRMFSTAKAIVAAHGAGLTNIIFSPRSTPIIELVPEDHFGVGYVNVNVCYCILCRALHKPWWGLLIAGANKESTIYANTTEVVDKLIVALDTKY